MANRYCGNIKISLTLVDAPHMPHGYQYKCTFSKGGEKLGSEFVGLPAHLSTAIDSAKMIDSTAKAAISFATEEGRDEGLIDIKDNDLEYADSGWRIRRRAR